MNACWCYSVDFVPICGACDHQGFCFVGPQASGIFVLVGRCINFLVTQNGSGEKDSRMV